MSEAVVVGAGPYGLSVAAHLRHAGVETRVFGDVMASWRRHMPAGMRLKSTPDASSLSAPVPGSTIFDYCDAIGSRVLTSEPAIPVELFVDYGDWFAARHVPDVDPATVVRIEWTGDRFAVHTGAGDEHRTRVVVVACGVVPYAYVPAELRHLVAADGPLTHTSEHADLGSFGGSRVAVVGGGQSALESAALLADAGAEVHVVVRAPRVLWGGPPVADPNRGLRLTKPHSGLGEGWSLRAVSGAPWMVRHLPGPARHALVRSVLGPSGAWWLREQVEGRVDVRVGTGIHAARPRPDGGARLELVSQERGVEVLEVDRVLAATGYRVDIGRLGFLSPGIRTRVRRTGDAPLLDGSFQSSVSGLYFTGLTAAATFGPLLRFVYGTEFASRRIIAAIVAGRRPVAA
jgi:cation diffusion facilitator CzcD-associated flavoprotein CzcO